MGSIQRWNTNDEENDFSAVSIRQGGLLKDKKTGNLVFKNHKDGSIYPVEKISLQNFLMRYYAPLVLTVFGFALLTTVLAPVWTLFIMMTEAILYQIRTHCTQKTKRRIIYAFRVIFLGEIVIIGAWIAYVLLTRNTSSVFTASEIFTGFTLFNFYLFARLYLATRLMMFGKEIYRLSEHSGFYLWRDRRCS